MSFARSTFFTAFLLPAVASTCATLLVVSCAMRERNRDEMQWIADAARLIRENHLSDVSARQLTWDAIRGMAEARDRYSDFVDPDHAARFLEETEGHWVGLGFTVHEAGPAVTVLFAFPGSPAAAVGLEPGDRIVAVDGQDVTHSTVSDVIRMIKIENGQKRPVKLAIQPWSAAGAAAPPRREVTAVRDDVEKPSAVDATVIDAEHAIGYVRLTRFQEHTAAELRAQLRGLAERGIKGLVLDLRGNGGGLLDEAVGVCGTFLPGNSLVLVSEGRAPDTSKRYLTSAPQDPKDDHRDLPLVILVDGETASASEVVSGALQDYCRALLVGERTYGKGMVQQRMIIPYEVDGVRRDGVLKVTVSRYVTPTGRFIENLAEPGGGMKRGGLVPDQVVPIDRNVRGKIRDWFAWREIPATERLIIETRLPDAAAIHEPAPPDPQLQAAVEILLGTRVPMRRLVEARRS